MPMALGQGGLEELPQAPVGVWLLQALLAAVVGFFIVRNLVRLWRAPAIEASNWTVIPLLVVGGLFLLFSSGPLIESEKLSTKPMGLAVLIIGVILVSLSLRGALRLRAHRTAAFDR